MKLSKFESKNYDFLRGGRLPSPRFILKLGFAAGLVGRFDGPPSFPRVSLGPEPLRGPSAPRPDDLRSSDFLNGFERPL